MPSGTDAGAGYADDSGAPPPASSPEGLSRALRLVLWDSLASEGMGTLTTGVFLVGLAVALDASNFMIGVLAAIPFLVQLLQIPAVLLVERLRRRRRTSVLASGIGRTFLLAIAAAPFLSEPAAIVLVAVALAIHQGFGAISGCAWNSWMRDLVPETRYGRFFGLRNFATTTLATLLSLGAGAFVAHWTQLVSWHGAYAYSVLFFVGGISGLVGVYLLAKTPEPPMAPPEARAHLFRLLAEPFHDANFRHLIASLGTWNFAANLAAPFLTVYMLRTLDFSMSTVVLLNVISQLANLSFLHIWGRLSDRFGNRSVLKVTAPLFLGCLLVWSVTGVAWMHAVIVPIVVVLHALMGLATAGVGLASGNIAMKLSPVGRATAYLAVNSVVTSLCASAASLLGGAAADFFAAHELALSFRWKGPGGGLSFDVLDFRSWTFLFAIAFLAGLFSLYLLGRVEERGEIKEPIALEHLVSETRRSIHGLSSAAGLYKLARFPFALLRRRL